MKKQIEMTRKKFLTGISLILLLNFSLLASLNLMNKPQENRSNATTILSLSLPNLNKTLKETFTAEIAIENALSVNGADLYLTFNPNVLEAINILPGSFFKKPTEIGSRQIDNANGKIVYSLGVFDNANAKSGSGILAKITFRAKTTGISPLTLTAGTSIAALGQTEALQNKINGSVTVLTPTPTPFTGNLNFKIKSQEIINQKSI